MLGIIVKDLSCSQLNYELFTQINKIHRELDIFVVYKNITKSFFPIKFPIINYTKVFSGYIENDSLLIATDLDSALTLSKVKNTSKKIFYVWELEFLRNKNYSYNYDIYQSLPLYTRSQSYKEALDNYANTNSDVLELNLEKLWTLNT